MELVQEEAEVVNSLEGCAEESEGAVCDKITENSCTKCGLE